jgi:hypothetical protein
MRTKYNFGLPVVAGGCAVKLFKRMSKIAFSAFNSATLLPIFASTAANAIDCPNSASAVFITLIGSQLLIFKSLLFLSAIKNSIPANF